MLLATTSEPVVLSMVAADGRQDLYAQARVYDSGGGLVDTLDLVHIAEGLYSSAYMPTLSGYFNVVYELYFDAPRTVSAGYEKQGESLDVSEFRTNILRLLGLAHQNSLVDSQTYTIDGNLTFARIRVYDSAANVAAAAAISPAAYVTGLRFEYEVHANYSGEALDRYYIVRIS